MRILVTGGAGFIGSHLVEYLVQRGHHVWVQDSLVGYPKDKNVELLRQLIPNRLHVRDLNVGMPNLFSDTERPDLVVHLAALAGVRPSMEDPLAYISANIRATQALLLQMVRAGVKNLVFASSSSVYGDNDEGPFREDQILSPPASVYAETKLTGENLCRIYHKTHGMNIHCLRFFTAYGPRQRPDLAIHKFVEMIRVGRRLPLYGLGTKRDYTYVLDIVRGIGQSITRLIDRLDPEFEIINLGAGSPVMLEDLVEKIRLAMGLEKVLVDVLSRQPGDVLVTHADITKAKRLLGYAPVVSFEEGLKDFVTWYQSTRGE